LVTVIERRGDELHRGPAFELHDSAGRAIGNELRKRR
jgi:hypothetical protein